MKHGKPRSDNPIKTNNQRIIAIQTNLILIKVKRKKIFIILWAQCLAVKDVNKLRDRSKKNCSFRHYRSFDSFAVIVFATQNWLKTSPSSIDFRKVTKLFCNRYFVPDFKYYPIKEIRKLVLKNPFRSVCVVFFSLTLTDHFSMSMSDPNR